MNINKCCISCVDTFSHVDWALTVSTICDMIDGSCVYVWNHSSMKNTGSNVMKGKFILASRYTLYRITSDHWEKMIAREIFIFSITFMVPSIFRRYCQLINYLTIRRHDLAIFFASWFINSVCFEAVVLEGSSIDTREISVPWRKQYFHSTKERNYLY